MAESSGRPRGRPRRAVSHRLPRRRGHRPRAAASARGRPRRDDARPPGDRLGALRALAGRARVHRDLPRPAAVAADGRRRPAARGRTGSRRARRRDRRERTQPDARAAVGLAGDDARRAGMARATTTALGRPVPLLRVVVAGRARPRRPLGAGHVRQARPLRRSRARLRGQRARAAARPRAARPCRRGRRRAQRGRRPRTPGRAGRPARAVAGRRRRAPRARRAAHAVVPRRARAWSSRSARSWAASTSSTRC